MRRASWIVRMSILLAIVVILVVSYFFAFGFYQNQAFERGNYGYTQDNTTDEDNYIEVAATLTEIDALKREFKVRLNFYLYGSLVVTDGATAAKDLKIYINNITQKEYNIKKNELVSALDIVVPMGADVDQENPARKLSEAEKQALRAAQVNNYPFDKYAVGLYVLVAEPPAEGQPVDLSTLKQVPVYFSLSNLLPNYKIAVTKNNTADKPEGEVAIIIEVSRAATVVFYFYFVMIVMGLISITAFAVSLTAALFPVAFELGTRLDYDIFAYMAALLFAFPALRETMPETPRLGALGDYLVFFWAEGLIALALVLAVSVWLVQRYNLHNRHRKIEAKQHLHKEELPAETIK